MHMSQSLIIPSPVSGLARVPTVARPARAGRLSVRAALGSVSLQGTARAQNEDRMVTMVRGARDPTYPASWLLARVTSWSPRCGSGCVATPLPYVIGARMAAATVVCTISPRPHAWRYAPMALSQSRWRAFEVQVNKGAAATGKPYTYVGVFDGHGGFAAADWLEKNLYSKIDEEWPEDSPDRAVRLPVPSPRLPTRPPCAAAP
jgi:hypothetical protein